MNRKATFAAVLAIAACAGCSQKTLNSAQQDANHNAAVVDQKAKQAEDNAKPALDKLGLETRVTTALAAANLPTTIHVRADADGVYLRGTVKSEADKTRAGQIAQDTLGAGKTVHNALTVAP